MLTTYYSNTGKRLMAKCRLLYQENEELGRMIASGRIAKLEGELALQKSFSEEVKKSQSGILQIIITKSKPNSFACEMLELTLSFFFVFHRTGRVSTRFR